MSRMAANRQTGSDDRLPVMRLGWAVFLLAVGAFFGLALVKFGNPVIFEDQFPAPANLGEFFFQPWPQKWGYLLLAAVFAASFPFWRGASIRQPPRIWIPALWLLWELVATSQSIDPGLSSATLRHFATTIACYYLGFFVVSRARWEGFRLLLLPLGIAFVWALRVGMAQHFGGLEATRRYFYEEMLPTLGAAPPEFLVKLSSNRIFSTLFYPNTFAGAILLFLPITLALLTAYKSRIPFAGRAIIGAIVATASLACLYWSGSKSGWLILMLMTVAVALRLISNINARRMILALILIGGLGGFIWTYMGFFQRGAGSIGARIDYWKAVCAITAENPFFGTGPGTFSISYQRVKRADAEMARLAHNDYLQQASDSGLPGFILYILMILSFVRSLYRYRRENVADCFVGIGVAGFFVQSLSEFGLYIPALAWPAFLFVGFLQGRLEGKRMDKVP